MYNKNVFNKLSLMQSNLSRDFFTTRFLGFLNGVLCGRNQFGFECRVDSPKSSANTETLNSACAFLVEVAKVVWRIEAR